MFHLLRTQQYYHLVQKAFSVAFTHGVSAQFAQERVLLVESTQCTRSVLVSEQMTVLCREHVGTRQAAMFWKTMFISFLDASRETKQLTYLVIVLIPLEVIPYLFHGGHYQTFVLFCIC